MSSHLSSDPRNAQLIQRRVRHVTSIQIRNLTPFPGRDTLASALTQPAQQPQFTSSGHLSDDLDVTLSRRRSRRISTNSIATYRSLRSGDGMRDDGVNGGVGEIGRRASASRVSFSEEGARNRRYSISGSAPAIRAHRPPSTSTGASAGYGVPGPSVPVSPSLSGSLNTISSIMSDNSQSGLEKVIESRLVETFLTITIPSPSSPPDTPLPPRHAPLGTLFTIENHKAIEGRPSQKGSKLSPSLSIGKGATKARRDAPSSSRPSPKSFPSHVKSASASLNRLTRDLKRTPSQPIPPLRTTASVTEPPSPNYFSSIHRPSTNPSFLIDALSALGGDWASSSSHRMKVEVWGKVLNGFSNDKVQAKGKGKKVEESGDTDMEWRVLDEWDVDLGVLLPLPQDLTTHPAQFPSNSLLITLSPPGKTFYLPSRTGRPTSPPPGYASDPESEVRKVKQLNETPTSDSAGVRVEGEGGALSLGRYHEGAGSLSLPRDVSKTASYQELFRLVNLQSCILDHGASLSDIMHGVDEILEGDTVITQRREVSEREVYLSELIANREQVVEESCKLRNEIKARIENLKQRRQILALARDQLHAEIDAEFQKEKEIAQNRAQRLSLRARLAAMRTTLLTILSSIFPIELLSSPDLLYTILDVSLPIPLSSSDPAPPLALLGHKEVTEDAVATSLGYAAQVVHLLSAYLGKGLVYPVTCIGSRSLIRDGISAMVGPRMFPLYSKGVDTYRFEYGVFLLNKNIELLMADGDLQALDMRHTLPNLKNLLLTLTDGEGAPLQRSQPRDSPMSLVSNMLEEETFPTSGMEPNPSTPRAVDSFNPSGGGATPPASGSTTPTVAAFDASKKARPFLSFPPFPGFFRSRNPSSIRDSDSHTSDDPEDVQDSLTAGTGSGQQDLGDEEEEDRMTISGIPRDRNAEEGRKLPAGFDTVVLKVEDEKLVDGDQGHSLRHSDPSVQEA